MNNNIKSFESFDRPEEKPRDSKKPKKENFCVGQCERQFYMENGKAVVYCPSCERIIRIKN